MYGGYHPELDTCRVHVVEPTVRGVSDNMFFRIQDKLYITISDPWDPRWEKGVQGKLYDSYQWSPQGTVYIKREWTTVNPTLTEFLNTQAQVTSNILKTEQALKQKIQSDPYPCSLQPARAPLSWARVIRETIRFPNASHILSNVSDCFLCASLQRPLVAAVPVGIFQAQPVNSEKDCGLPLSEVPMWKTSLKPKAQHRSRTTRKR